MSPALQKLKPELQSEFIDSLGIFAKSCRKLKDKKQESKMKKKKRRETSGNINQ